jgi:hypothetical protein
MRFLGRKWQKKINGGLWLRKGLGRKGDISAPLLTMMVVSCKGVVVRWSLADVYGRGELVGLLPGIGCILPGSGL